MACLQLGSKSCCFSAGPCIFCHGSAAKGPDLQRIAFAAVKTGVTAPDIQLMASFGNFGRNPNHVAGQVTKQYCQSDDIDIPEPYVIDLPVRVRTPDDWALGTRQVGIFLPHEWWAWMSDKEAVSGLSGLADFWEGQDLSDPKLEGNPLMTEDYKTFCPIVIHGDGGAFQRSDSIEVISMRSLLSSSNVSTSQLLLAAVPKSCISKSDKDSEDTMRCLWEVLAWSFTHIYYGKWPEFDHAGRAWPQKSMRKARAGSPLNPDGYSGVIWSITADGEYMQNSFFLPGHSFNDCCWSCQANKSDRPHNDYRANAKWRATVVSHCGTSPTSHLVTTIPGVVGNTFAYDCLHILEEGVASHILANCMFDFVVKGPSSQDQNLKNLWKKLCQQYLEQGISSSNQVRKLTMSSFCNPKSKQDSFPVMSGVKARHMRYLVPCILEIVREMEKPDDPYSRHRVCVVDNLERMYLAMESCHIHMTSKASQQLLKCTSSCLLHYVKLANLSIASGSLQWSTVHKHHLACHLAEQGRWMNPRFQTTYSGETMVGMMSSLAHCCLNGTAPHQVPLKVALRFRLSMHSKFMGSMELLDSAEES